MLLSIEIFGGAQYLQGHFLFLSSNSFVFKAYCVCLCVCVEGVLFTLSNLYFQFAVDSSYTASHKEVDFCIC